VNEYMTVTNGALATKHVFAGASRVVSKQVEPAHPPFLFGVPNEDDQVFYHEDHNGNVTFTSDAYGALNEHVEYFPFGEAWIQEVAGPAQTPYLFSSKELDPESELYYFGARYYEPRQGTWLSADPILWMYLDGADAQAPRETSGGVYESENLGVYGYVWNNPLRYTDPTGEGKYAEDTDSVRSIRRNAIRDYNKAHGTAGTKQVTLNKVAGLVREAVVAAQEVGTAGANVEVYREKYLFNYDGTAPAKSRRMDFAIVTGTGANRKVRLVEVTSNGASKRAQSKTTNEILSTGGIQLELGDEGMVAFSRSKVTVARIRRVNVSDHIKPKASGAGYEWK
jgi:RHS repeat-associated protein